MTLQPIRDVQEYKRLKESLKTRFESDRTGDQQLFTEQTKIFQPLIKTQQDTSKAIQKEIAQGQATAADALAPLARELQRRNEQVDMLAELPFYKDDVPGPAPKNVDKTATPEPYNPDKYLTETDVQNLFEMGFPRPSRVLDDARASGLQNAMDILDRVKTMNRSIGQKLSKSSKASEEEKVKYTSRKNTLEVYKESIKELTNSIASSDNDDEFVAASSSPIETKPKKKSGKGVETIYYPNVEELCNRLSILCAAKEAGNSGLNNHITSILDELLRVNAIDMPEYNKLYKKIFLK